MLNSRNNNAPGNCCYCGKPLTENERDFESGYFSSAHFVCVQPTATGPFRVVDGEGKPAGGSGGFTTMRRAVAEADYLARFNPGYTFKAIIAPGGAR